MSDGLSRQAAVPILVGVLVLTGIGLVGAALPVVEEANATDSTQVEEEGQQATGEAPGAGVSELNGSTNGTRDRDTGAISRCVEPLASTGGTSLVALTFLGIVALVFRRTNFSAALLFGWTTLPPTALAYFLLTNCASGSGPAGPSDGRPGVPGGEVALDVAVDVPPWALLGVAGVVLVGAVGMMYRSMSEEDVVVPSEDIDDEPDLDEFAAAAGRAADRIEEHSVDVDNAVYRAWVEMTDLIEVDNPDVYSPGEFAETAVALGMDESDVSELTELFNEVRYGDRDASAREDRAVSVLRRIESAYSGAAAAASDADPRTNGPDDSNGDGGPQR